jgi:hypothetical protein
MYNQPLQVDHRNKMPFKRKIPQTMLRVMMRKSAELNSVEARREFAARAKELRNQEGSRKAISYLLDKLGIEITLDRAEDYCAEVLNFHLGLLEA